MRSILSFAVLTAATNLAAAGTIGPTDAQGLQRAIDALEPGDTLTLRAGDYDLTGVAALPRHAISVTRSGVAIEGEDGARLVGPPRGGRIWTTALLVQADGVTITGVEFHGFSTAVGVGWAPRGQFGAQGVVESPAVGLRALKLGSWSADGCTVSDNVFVGSEVAIEVLGGDGFTARGNRITDVAYGVSIDGFVNPLGASPIVLDDNRVIGAQWTGLHLQGVGPAPVFITRNEVRDQVNPETPKFAAIRVRDAMATVEIDDNWLIDTTRGFLGHNNVDLRFTNNQVIGSRCSAIVTVLAPFIPSYVAGSTALFTGNTLAWNHGHAIFESGYRLDGDDPTLIEANNTIEGNGTDGIVAVAEFGAIIDMDQCDELE